MLQQEKKRQQALQILKTNFINSFLENKLHPQIKGRVINETKNSFLVETNQGEKRTLKQNNIFTFTFQDKKKYKINGNLLVGNIWERLKKY
ncbi:MAG: hypothetical protein COW47_02190 [Candidatus Huberarchaeum crystalense]|uniref:Ribonuclease P protein component 1 n=1 Tax=Huberarchaeum crystalense TaxID=2014257 RepID=A0A2H9RD18_HUBC1|nr:hypothetical protein [archaeon]OIP20629.1 MAG: hypothetical protein AUJ91_00860 [archaeon CG2_30_31_98]PIV13656.1 MAG: hypothetical protein COS45_01740 [Candidatus Huberarchaeum crystalense]NCS98248.1 hypothetical protein [archaeon]PIV46480.1 MAG: hypothetical protein COS22_01130 [Candidatus Huberarchaeum crystalense]